MKKTFIFFSLLILVNSCKKTIINDSQIIPTQVITKEGQQLLTPELVLKELKEGNKASIEDKLTIRNNTLQVRNATIGQYPEAVVLSCLDSRIPVEDIFHQSIGELYVLKTAGNIVDDNTLGGMEYSCKIAGAKVIIILGHTYCSTIKSSIADIEFGHFSNIVEKINPSILSAKTKYKGYHSENNPLFLDAVCKHNIYNSTKIIRESSPILREMEQQNKIKIISAIYDIQTGKVQFI